MFTYLLKYYQVRNDLFKSIIYDLIFLSALDLFKSPSEKKTRVNDNMSIRSQRCPRVSEPFNFSCPLKLPKQKKEQ